MFWFAAKTSLFVKYCIKWSLFVIWTPFKLNEEGGMMRWGGKRKSNFDIDFAELPKNEKKKYFSNCIIEILSSWPTKICLIVSFSNC